MAKLQGISGLTWGDGASGKIAYGIKTTILRILASSNHAYLTATPFNPQSLNSGTVSYYVPEFFESTDYGNAGEGAFYTPEAGLISVNLGYRRKQKWEVEDFDEVNFEQAAFVLAQTASALAQAILKDLNAYFIQFLVNESKKDPAKYQIALPGLGDETGDIDVAAARKDWNKLQIMQAKMRKIYDKRHLGVPKEGFITIVDEIVDINMRNAFWSEYGGKELYLKENIAGVQLGLVKYTTDNMFNIAIAAGTSFTDKGIDFTNYLGVFLHNEAIAMPFHWTALKSTLNPENGNRRFITKYQFGLGIIRPQLWKMIVKTLDPQPPTARGK